MSIARMWDLVNRGVPITSSGVDGEVIYVVINRYDAETGAFAGEERIEAYKAEFESTYQYNTDMNAFMSEFYQATVGEPIV
jgi:hypothetical protein